MTSLDFTKGHGTQNDFVLLDDSDGTLPVELSDDVVRFLADRRAGLGADGVIRVVRSIEVEEGRRVLESEPGATWFMDYRNADGSIAQMCGNGVRVFAAYLEQLGLVTFVPGVRVPIGTRAGLRTIEKIGEWFRVGMGEYSFPAPAEQVALGADSSVAIRGLSGIGGSDARPALSVDMGNPHTVVALASLEDLAGIDFTAPPAVEPVPPHGTNVEAVVPGPQIIDDRGHLTGHVTMRVHERGVGETRSCGTGACAAALAVRHWMTLAGVGAGVDDGRDAGASSVPDAWLVDIPGGTVKVEVEGRNVYLSGPAVLVAAGQVELP